LIYEETFATRAEAMAREKFLKTGKGREFLKTKLARATDPPRRKGPWFKSRRESKTNTAYAVIPCYF
jgi:hypothetical protein